VETPSDRVVCELFDTFSAAETLHDSVPHKPKTDSDADKYWTK